MAKGIKAGPGYYSPSDVMALLNVSRFKALEIMHMFERHGKLERFGPRTLRVSIAEFDKWRKANGEMSNGKAKPVY